MDKKIKWGVIGSGRIAERRTIPGILEAKNAELVMLMDTNAENVERLGKQWNVAYTTDIDELLSSDVEAVYIATPVFCHKEHAVKAAKAGKHILLEKPIGMSTEEADDILCACSQAGVKLAMGFMMRYHAHHVQVKELIASGAIGDVVSMRGQFCSWYPPKPGAWRQTRATSGGGALMDLGVHCLDLLQYMSGQIIKRVAGLCSTQTFDYEIDDSASVMFRTEQGAHGYVDANFNVRDDVSDTKLEFYGTKGSIICYGTVSQEEIGSTKVSITLKGDGYDINHEKGAQEVYELTHVKESLYKKEVESFNNSILTDAPIVVPGEDGAYIQKICEAAYESSQKGIWVEL